MQFLHSWKIQCVLKPCLQNVVLIGWNRFRFWVFQLHRCPVGLEKWVETLCEVDLHAATRLTRCPPLTGTTKHTPTDFKTPTRGSILEIEPLVMWLWLLSLFLCVVKHPWIYEFSKNSWEFIGLGIYRLIHKYYMIFVIVNVILFFTVAGI